MEKDFDKACELLGVESVGHSMRETITFVHNGVRYEQIVHYIGFPPIPIDHQAETLKIITKFLNKE